ncbi:unnamed protein product, partial [Ixodes hexagonus]
QTYAPQPYQFGYETQDEYGNRQSRHEQDAGNGVKTGSYGYRDAYGLYRQVQYVADSAGFRAWVKTNEPGTQDSAPASAKIESNQPHPSALSEAHTAAHYVVARPRGVHLSAVGASPAFSLVRKVPVHHSLYPVAAATARHASIQRAYSHQVPHVYKHSFRRLAVAAPVAAPVASPVANPVAVAPVVPVTRVLAASPHVALPPVVSALESSPVVVDLAEGGPYRTVKKVRRPKPVEFFKKSIIRKRRPKTPRVRVRVVSATKNGEVVAADIPVYKDK